MVSSFKTEVSFSVETGENIEEHSAEIINDLKSYSVSEDVCKNILKDLLNADWESGKTILFKDSVFGIRFHFYPHMLVGGFTLTGSE